MCKCGTIKPVRVKVPADLSCTGKDRWKDAKVDSCIADIVCALQKSGIDMRGSCCGHFVQEGDIMLQDGRTLLILDKETSDVYYKEKTCDTSILKYILQGVKEEKR